MFSSIKSSETVDDVKKVKRAFFQPKLNINQPNDVYEQEADHMAEKVMRTILPPPGKSNSLKSNIGIIQRKCQACEEEDKHVRRKESNNDATQGNNQLDSYVNSLGSSGQSIPGSSRQFFEPRFGHDFSNVKVHTDSVAAKSAQSINALAYTIGNHIVFNSGQYSPDTPNGKKLMAHELTHVIQQSGNVQPKTIQRMPGSPAGGCGLCYGTSKAVGLAAHTLIEEAFQLRYPWIQTEYPVLGSPTDDNGKLDLADLDGSSHMSIGEIKPANPTGLANGEADLIWYEKQLNLLGMNTSRMSLPPPIAAIPFPTLAPPDCPQIQQLYIDPAINGTYTYWCAPDYKDLIKECDCKKGKRKPKDIPVPLPLPIPEKKPVKKPVDEPVSPPVTDPVPVIPPVVNPTPVTPPVTVPSPQPTDEGIPTWVYISGGVAGALLIAGCIASGVCEVAAVVAAFGAAAEAVMAFFVTRGVVFN